MPTDGGLEAIGEAAATDVGEAAATDVFVANDGSAVLNGTAEKGPLVSGSTVILSSIDHTGVPTGQVFTVQTNDDLGNFTLNLAYRGYLDVQASGFYFNEITGALSLAPVVLRALYDVNNGGPQAVNVNVITHLAHDRALRLLADGGASLAAAESQAERELVAAFGIGGTAFQLQGAGTGLNEVGPNSDENAYLLAVSAIVTSAALAQTADGGGVDAQLQQFLAMLASDLAASGTLPANLTSQFRAIERNLDADLVMDRFAQRLQAIGSSAGVVDLNRAIDSDGDGYRNSIDTCPLVANPNQAQIPTGVICKVTRHTTFLQASSPSPANSYVLPGDFAKTGHVGLYLPPGFQGASAAVLKGDGAGRFALASSVSLQFIQRPGGRFNVDQANPKVAFDVDGDGNLDLVSEGTWAAGDGSGHFAAPIAFPDPFPVLDASPPIRFEFFRGIGLADFNGDGLNDVVRAGASGEDAFYQPFNFIGYYSNVSIQFGTAKGVFSQGGLFPALSLNTVDQPTWVLIGDVNKDQHLDVLVTEALRPTANVFLGDGLGGFRQAASFSLLYDGSNGTALGDFDGDGNLDVAGWTSGAVWVGYGDGMGGFGSPINTSLDAQSYGPSFAVGDFNGDGKADMLGTLTDPPPNQTAVHLGVLLSEGRTFGPPQLLRTGPISSGGLPGQFNSNSADLGVSAVSASDLNADGIPDVVLLSRDQQGNWTLQSILMGVLQ
jgi:hypothetical protein